jgi:hypothetical protein
MYISKPQTFEGIFKRKIFLLLSLFLCSTVENQDSLRMWLYFFLGQQY